MGQDKQLRYVSLEAVVEKRRLEQALNAKEFAVLVGISYASALEWFHIPGFPVFRGFVFWEDFTEWRRSQTGLTSKPLETRNSPVPSDSERPRIPLEELPPRAARILLQNR